MKYTEIALRFFLDTGTKFSREFIWAMGLVKFAAAKANTHLGVLGHEMGLAIQKAARELMDGKLDDQIVVDVFQTGSGTGINTNVNEVIAARAKEISGLNIHPNDHVNKGQSSNDVVPSAIRIAAYTLVKRDLLPALSEFIEELKKLSERTRDVVKPGRTHLRDALPVTMGNEFKSYLEAFKRDLAIISQALDHVKYLPLGGTAVGTGVNTHPRFREITIKEISDVTGEDFQPIPLPYTQMKLLSDLQNLSNTLNILATDLYRLSQDIRLMFSGPFTGIGEIDMEIEIAGSSIMPGKTNPVTVEATLLACVQVMGLNYANNLLNMLGEFELSMGIPLMGHNIIQQIKLLTEALIKMSTHVLPKIIPRKKRARDLAEKSPALITILSPKIGYDKATEVAKKVAEGKSLREVFKELGFSDDEIRKIVDLDKLAKGLY